MHLLHVTTAAAFAVVVLAWQPASPRHLLHPPVVHQLDIAPQSFYVSDRSGKALPPLNTTYYFDQLIDHTNPDLGTFKQRYWHSWKWYEPGGPIVVYVPGEANAEPLIPALTNVSTPGRIAQQEYGATIVLEHRYYGESTPTPDLSVPSLKYHTIQQAINDLEYFAKNVKLPMPGGDAVGPSRSPWVLSGSSYSGALVSWTMVNKPGVFWAGYASSGVVQAIEDFWTYWEPVRQFMPQNCSADVQAVATHIDSIAQTGSKAEMDALKGLFGLQNLTHFDDFAAALRYDLFGWQALSPSTGPNATFYQFCDALEVKDGVAASPEGWGLEHALTAWGNHWKSTYLHRLCGDSDAETCLGTYDPANNSNSDISLGNDQRAWSWIVCNEVGFYQTAAPQGHPSLLSRLVSTSYFERACPVYFPGAFNSSLPKPTSESINKAYGGWDARVDRLFHTNGKRDPWRVATVSADGHDFESTALHRVAVHNAFHASDLSTKNGMADKSVADVQEQVLAAMHEWLAEFKPAKTQSEQHERRSRWDRD